MRHIAISRLHFPVNTLGPGRRVGVWFQGCSIRCPGCISVDTWEHGLGATNVDSVLGALASWAVDSEGLTVTGGEPFDQPEALGELLTGWRGLSKRNVLVFTGYPRTAVAPWLARNTGLIDALVSGPYDRNAAQTMALRGSDNQQLHVLSRLGLPLANYDRLATCDDHKLDVMFDADGGAWFAGIPGSGDFQRFRRLLEADGHRVMLFGEDAKADL